MTNEVLINTVDTTKAGSGIGVIGAYTLQDEGKRLDCKKPNSMLICKY